MTDPRTAALFAALDRTWPAAAQIGRNGWTLRQGAGGGSRVSAATRAGDAPAADAAAISAAAHWMRAQGQHPLFMIRGNWDTEERAFDQALADRGYDRKDPTLIYSHDVQALADRPPAITAYSLWPPLAVQDEIWAEGGIGPARLAVMARAEGPKTSLFGRAKNRPAGTAFVAMDGPIAMLHALEIRPEMRRMGLGTRLVRTAAHWAQSQGARTLALLVTEANGPANALYASLGFQAVGKYHYRRTSQVP